MYYTCFMIPKSYLSLKALLNQVKIIYLFVYFVLSFISSYCEGDSKKIIQLYVFV